MKKLGFMVSVVFMFLVFPNTINAAYVDASTIPSKVGSNCTPQSCWPVLEYQKEYDSVKGMRVTLMQSDGRPYSGAETLNVIYDPGHYNWLYNNYGYYFWSGNGNKVQDKQGWVPIGAPVQKTQGYANPSSGGKTLTLRLSSELDPYFSKFGISFSGNLKEWNISNIWNGLEGEDLNVEALSELMFQMFKVNANDMTDEVKKDLWIVAEPMTVVIYNSKYYFGTHYELASLGYSNIATTSINTVIGRRMACAALTTGSILEKHPNDTPGGNVSAKSYFYGALQSVQYGMTASRSGSNTLQTVCGFTEKGGQERILSDTLVSTTAQQYGVGINILRFPVPSKLTCQDVEKSNSPWLKGISLANLNNLPDELNYQTSTGQWKKISKEWYKKECTCYGVYEEYQNKTGRYLPSLTQQAIQNIFASNISLFDNFYKDYNTKYEKVATSTMWDYKKYETLNCGYAKAQCKDVKFSDMTFSSGNSSPERLASYSCVGSLGQRYEFQGIIFGWPHYGYVSEKKYYDQYIRRYGYVPSYNVREFSRQFQNCYWDVYYTQNEIINDAREKNNYINRYCKNLPLSGSSGYTTSYVNQNSYQYDRCFQYYNELNGTNWNLNSYKNSGCAPTDGITPPPKKYDCTPQYNVGTCTNGETNFYSDRASNLSTDDYWKYCVFSDENSKYFIDPHKSANKNASLTYYDSNISTKYCEVYCTESMTSNFNSDTITVLAGNHFTWDNHSVSGSRTCKTKEVKYTQFVNDLRAANQDTINKYVAWQLEEKLAKVRWTRSSKKDCDWSCDSYYPTYPCPCEEGKSCGTCGGGCRRGSYKDYNYTPSSTVESFFASSNGFSSSAAQGLSTTCGSPGYSANPSSYKRAYENALDYAEGLVDQMKACYNDGPQAKWDRYTYNVNPQANVSYSDGNYSYSGPMEVDTSYTKLDSKMNCTSNSQPLITSCSGKNCTITTQRMQNCKTVEMTKGATSRFTLPDGLFEYIDKTTHQSYHYADFQNLLNSARSQNKTLNYIYLGYSNFPVAYRTKDGWYGEGHGQGQLSLNYSHLGYTSGGSTAVDTILKATNNQDYNNWKCEFQVASELIPEKPRTTSNNKNKGINLIYRPIDLYDPFPDMDATGRETGSNWCDGRNQKRNCSNRNNTVSEYILNNRGVSGEEIYKETPMYTFVLTPAIIKELRDYNKENGYDTYTGSYSGKTYDFECKKGTGGTCISDYLTHVIDITNARNYPGVCVQDRFRSVNDPTAFNNCRY